MQAFLEAAVREALDDPTVVITRLVPAGGGYISHAARALTSAGDLFVKWNASGPEDLFLREADGLREMAAAGSGLQVPRVLGAWGPQSDRPALIVMEYLPPGRTADSEALGRGLAALHRRTAAQFGFPVASYCGTTRQDNAWSSEWASFYRERRLRSLIARVEVERRLSAADRRVYERLLERLPSLLTGHDAPPALIHGDLWSGNVVHTVRGPGLVDPACAYADREMEFGITTLFGGFDDRFFRAYEEAWPLPSGWRERNPLYQLYHLLNHHYLFGEHYGADALAIARRYT